MKLQRRADVNGLLIPNGAPCGSERTPNVPWLAMDLKRRHDDVPLTVLSTGDATLGATRGQRTLDGYDNVERTLRACSLAPVASCSAPRALIRGVNVAELVDGAEPSTMDELGGLTVEFDRVLVF